MYNIKYSKEAEKFFKKHRNDPISKKIAKALYILSEEPHNNILDTKELKNNQDLYRLRIGKYRIIYQILDDELIILCLNIGARGDIYKK